MVIDESSTHVPIYQDGNKREPLPSVTRPEADEQATFLRRIASETEPQALADVLDTLLARLAHDRAVCRPLRIAREQLRVLAWQRFTARHEHSDKIARLCRRHQGHKRQHHESRYHHE